MSNQGCVRPPTKGDVYLDNEGYRGYVSHTLGGWVCLESVLTGATRWVHESYFWADGTFKRDARA